jgi:hypothetical protein
MITLTDAARSEKAKKAAKEILNILESFSFRDAQDAINSVSERLEYAMKEKVFHNAI